MCNFMEIMEIYSSIMDLGFLWIIAIAAVIFIIAIKIVSATIKEILKFVIAIGVLAAVVWVVWKTFVVG